MRRSRKRHVLFSLFAVLLASLLATSVARFLFACNVFEPLSNSSSPFVVTKVAGSPPLVSRQLKHRTDERVRGGPGNRRAPLAETPLYGSREDSATFGLRNRRSSHPSDNLSSGDRAIASKTPPSASAIEESAVFRSRTQESFNLSHASSKANRLLRSSARSRAPRFKWSKQSRLFVRALRPTAQSKRFLVRAEEFFRGSGTNSSCKDRFFMTWISPSDAFGPRELLAMESLFKSHRDACLLIVSNTMDSKPGAKLLKPFVDKGFRVAAISPDLAYFFKGTPAERWFRKLLRREVNPGDVPLGQNLSNLLRLAVLYKFGGVYLDADVIILRSFRSLRNSIGAQTIDAATGNWSRLNNAVMVFDRGHPLLFKFMEEFSRTFDGSRWGYNGPYLVSRVVSRLGVSPGFEFNVLPPAAFYPVDWSRINGLFKGPKNRSHFKWINQKLAWLQGGSFAVHLWNKHSRGMTVEEGSVIGRMLSHRCVLCNVSESVI